MILKPVILKNLCLIVRGQNMIERRREMGIKPKYYLTCLPRTNPISGELVGKISLSSVYGAGTGTDAPLVYYSTNKRTWQQLTATNVNFTTPLYLYGVNPNGFYSGGSVSYYLAITGQSVSGPITALLDKDNIINTLPCDKCFQYLFYLNSVDNYYITFPSTVTTRCYQYMFKESSIKGIDFVLPATTLATYCYSNMFSGCTSLSSLNKNMLPATTGLASNCYEYMFVGCTSLEQSTTENTLSLPSNKTVAYCYRHMFRGCSKITRAPVLSATGLTSNCYTGMFSGCTKLEYIKAMFKTTPSASYTSYWVAGVASSGTFVKNSAATWNVLGENGIPAKWTIQTASS